MNIWWTIHLRREAASVPLARRILLGTMESVGVEPQISHDIGVALTEACANVVEHAGAGAPDEYQVTVTLDSERCGVEVIDFGLGFTESEPSAAAADGRGAAAGVEAEPADDADWFLSDAAAAFWDGPLGEVPWTDGAEAERVPAGAAVGTAEAAPAPLRSADPVAALPPDPTAECGRGLFLIRALVDHVQFRNHPCRGAVVSFDKALRWSAGGRGGGALLRAS